MVSVFWGVCEIIFIDYLQKGKTINGVCGLLWYLSNEIKEKHSNLAKKKALFHQDNAPVHTSVIAMTNINELNFELFPRERTVFVRFNPLRLFSPSELQKMARW